MSKETLQLAGGARASNKKRRSFPKINALPGSLHAERKRCNRPNCRCKAGGEALHGPYLYRRWREGGRQRRQYVRPADFERVRDAVETWRRIHPPARSAREELAELRRLFRQLESLGV